MAKKKWSFEKMITGQEDKKPAGPQGKKPEQVKQEAPALDDNKKEKKPAGLKKKARSTTPARKLTGQASTATQKPRKMGRPPVDHGRAPFTSRCTPETWERMKELSTIEGREVGELVEQAFNDLLKKKKAVFIEYYKERMKGI